MNKTPDADLGARRDGETVVRLGRDSGLNVGGAVVRQASVFGITFLIAQVLGADALGIYAQAFALRALLMLACLLGMRVAMTYFVASYRADGDASGVRGAVRVGVGATAIVSTLVAIATIVLAPTLAEQYFNDTALTVPIQIAAVSLPFIVIMTVALAATQGFKTMRAFAGIGLVFEPATRLILTAAVLALGLGVDATLVVLLFSSAIAAVLALRSIQKRLTTLGPGKARHPFRAVSSYAAFSWVTSVATQGVLWGDIIILGAFVASEEIGVYQVATRVVLLATFAVAPLTASLAPRVADSWRRGNGGDVRDQYLTLTSWTWRLSLPVFLVLIAFTEPVLQIFGDEFSTGTTVALTLIAGGLVETLAAPASVVLNQVGRNRLNMVFALGALAVDVGLALLLIPSLGIEGAAIAWTVSLGVFGIVRMIAVRRLVTGCFPWSRSHTKGAVAAIVALLAGLGFGAVVSLAPFFQVVCGGLVILVVYLGVILALGLSDEDRRLLRSFGGSVAKLPIFRTGPLRRIRDRSATRNLEVPTGPTSIDRLISPLRYDILVRAGFFELARSNRDLIESDVPGLIQMAKQTDYYGWYCEVAAPVIGVDTDDQAAVDAAFGRRVRKSLDLLERYEASGGFDTRFPITVRPIEDEETPTGKHLVGERFDPVDGCHRLALLSLDRRDVLQPEEYRLLPTSAPLVDNTPTLIAVLDISPDEYYQFIGRGFLDDPVHSRDELTAGADAAGPEVSRDVAAVLAVDEPVLSEQADRA